MDSSSWLLMANIAIWLGIGSYLCLLAHTQKQLDRRIRQMELLNTESQREE